MNKAPPINGTNVIYEEPPLGTLKFQDGKSIVYSCLNPGNRHCNNKWLPIYLYLFKGPSINDVTYF